MPAEEHKRLSGTWKDREDLYTVMLRCRPDELVGLGFKRCVRSEVEIHDIVL